MTHEQSQRIAWQLALAGFAPFAVLALGAAILGQTHPLSAMMTDALRSYGAVILSFLGGIRWGAGLGSGGSAGRSYALSVIPALVGWLALFASDAIGLIVLIAAFGAQGAWDSFTFHGDQQQHWFARLRIVVTCLVTLALMVALLALR